MTAALRQKWCRLSPWSRHRSTELQRRFFFIRHIGFYSIATPLPLGNSW